MSQSTQKNASLIGTVVVIVVVLGAVAWVTSFWWMPPIGELISGSAEDHAEDHTDHAEAPTTIQLSDEARQTLGIDVQPLKRTFYEKTISIPARTIVVPGEGRAQVTSPSSGVISKIHVREGRMVAPRQPLFEIRLIHDEGIKVQFELLDALADREVVDADLKRLQELERRSPGTIQGTRILELIYKRRHLNHLIASRRQMLGLLGLPEADVDRMIEKHLAKADEADDEDEGHLDFRESLLLEKVVVSAPPPREDSIDEVRYLVEELNIVLGQHVESGNTLATLGDYQTLLIEGHAFERDLSTVREARDKAWPVTAAIERRGQRRALLENLYISDKALKVEAQSRAAKFYIELQNDLREVPETETMTRREEWKFRPGQRMELRVPVARISDALKVPLDAVAEEGLNQFVFQGSGNTFIRRPVRVLYRDEDFAVIEENRYVTAGVPIAMNGAYQLQLALLNKASDPAELSHGHAH